MGDREVLDREVHVLEGEMCGVGWWGGGVDAMSANSKQAGSRD